MIVSSEIRALADRGLDVAEIARTLDIRYQHAYNVVKKNGSRSPGRSVKKRVGKPSEGARIVPKPALSVDLLTGGGFTFAGRWIMTETGEIALDRPVAKASGVYAFAIDERVMYVGVATMGLAKRLYFYTRPGIRQFTNLRLNHMIRTELMTRPFLDVYTAVPADMEWNGLPVHACAGLELGLIQKYALPWNMRSAGKLMPATLSLFRGQASRLSGPDSEIL